MLARAHADAGSADVRLHLGGTCGCIEGRSFSTRAESISYRNLRAAVTGMTNMPEGRLAREAEIAYATLAVVTDLDCWHPHPACVTAEMAIAKLQANAGRARIVLTHAIQRLAAKWPTSAAHSALGAGLVTLSAAMTQAARACLQPLIARLL